jgi:[acyl-carrier-protein] S-malonyltransferase
MTNSFAMVFPGQGSQSTGMLAELATKYEIVKETFRLASSILDEDLWAITQSNDNVKRLNQTVYTQPIMLAADVAIYRCWQQQKGKEPSVMAGHSLGEYSALVCANVLSFEQGLKVVKARATYMTEAATNKPGAMAAVIGLDDDVLNSICQEAKSVGYVVPANFNSIGQTVLAGENEAVDKIIELTKAQGAKIAKKIPVSIASHCQLMQVAAEKLCDFLSHIEFSNPSIPIVQNVDAKVHTGNELKQMLVLQMTSPVQWVKTINTLVSEYAVSSIVECGPGKVLTGLNKRIHRSINYYMTSNITFLNTALTGV